MNKHGIRTHLIILIVAVLCVRLPFVQQAAGGDDPYYLAAAEHAQIDPLHPNHLTYVFQGRDVTFRGYPHPPGNAWILAALLFICGDIKEAPFHLFYVFFSLAAVLSVYALARRFSEKPLWAALLFLAAPVFLVNGNTLESDLPFTAFWLTGFALYAWDRRAFAALALCGAGLISYQSFLALPILLLYDRRGLRSWLPASAPLLTLIAWQCFERVTSGQFPAQVTAGYLSSYGYQRLALKLQNAAALFIHSWFLIFPLLVPFALRKRSLFLRGWIVIFLGAAMILFYAGAARYVLPIAAPLAVLASMLPLKWIAPALAVQLTVGLGLASVNYQHWNAYRDFARRIPASTKRVWVNAEWGLRFYLESEGALAVHEHQWIPTGDIVVTSDLGYPADISHGGRSLTALNAAEVRPTLPLRLIGLASHAGYATAAQGFLPFGISNGPVDRIHADILMARQPASSWLDMNSAAVDDQALSGLYRLEDNRYRWTAGSASVLLKPANSRVEADFYIPESCPARHVDLLLGDKVIAALDAPGPGLYTLRSQAVQSSGASVQVTLRVDKTFSVPGDNRALGVILTGIGFR